MTISWNAGSNGRFDTIKGALQGYGSKQRGNDLDLNGFALSDNNQLTSFRLDKKDKAKTLNITGVEGNLIGIDVRPANSKLYGLTDGN
jgi:Domain of unknown function (DUF4394)